MMLTIARGVGQGRRIALLTVLGNVFVAGFVQVSFLVLGLVTVVHAWYGCARSAKVGWCGLSDVAGHKNDCDFRYRYAAAKNGKNY